MSTFKKNAPVFASTTRSKEAVPGKVVAIHETAKGDWIEIKPDDKELKNFKTRAAFVTAA